jgi:hypothetical protein
MFERESVREGCLFSAVNGNGSGKMRGGRPAAEGGEERGAFGREMQGAAIFISLLFFGK